MPTKYYIRHGSFPRYYQFRHKDSRPQHFRELLPLCLAELQNRKNRKNAIHLLDIGCNIGTLTGLILSAMRESVGVSGSCVRGFALDIDKQLIEEATETHGAPMIEFAQADISTIARGEATENPIDDYLKRNSIPRFDFVSCFSVLMFVHLNHGDDGLKKVLDYVCSVTKFLVLELHQWSNYRVHERRMRREGGGGYPQFALLKWRGVNGELEQAISDYVVSRGFIVVDGYQRRNEWNRKIVIFSKID